jgi:hypothetical protein
MRLPFKWLLPAAQATVAIILLALWTYTLHRFASTVQLKPFSSSADFEHADTASYNRFARVDNFAAYWSVAANLPAMLVLVPLHQLLRDRIHSIHLFKSAWRILGFCSAGIGIWFFAGRFVDDALAVIRGRLNSRRRIGDVLFFFYIVVSSLLIFAKSEMWSFVLYFDAAALRVSSMCWLAFGCAGLLFQVYLARTRSRRALDKLKA